MSSANAIDGTALRRSAIAADIAGLRRFMGYFPVRAGVAGVVAAGAGSGVVPGVACDGAAGFSGSSSETAQSIAARFSIGSDWLFSKPRQSTFAILTSVAVNVLVLRAVNVNFDRYSNTP